MKAYVCKLGTRLDTWFVLFRNLVPVIGVFFFQWSAPLTIFNYWFDGLMGFVALLALLLPNAFRDIKSKAKCKREMVVPILKYIWGWLIATGALCMPYWGILIVWCSKQIFSIRFWSELAHSPELWATFRLMVGSHFLKVFRVDIKKVPKEKLRIQFLLLLLRGFAFIYLTIFPPLIIPAMAALLTLIELWPRENPHTLNEAPGPSFLRRKKRA